MYDNVLNNEFANKKNGIAPEEEIEKTLENIRENVIFYTRGQRFGEVEVRFAEN